MNRAGWLGLVAGWWRVGDGLVDVGDGLVTGWWRVGGGRMLGRWNKTVWAVARLAWRAKSARSSRQKQLVIVQNDPKVV
ncbi:hypothetical protein SAMN05421878_10250 [Actinobaculum suis]|uniref:Uncharacterized protein n=1 Tax=Actinobaculum suis TaxID=1657 RepID=A0A1G7A2R0_9ACTO|nr:hypothetical protein [Actinobaculum suis]MDY5152715.1 hypothetical protein [Actinobaculum suis]SDE09194.1 hypothetical protein SAMN05421878_10250 [Actinobaculum suis]